MSLALDRMRELWEFTTMPAAQIGAQLRCSKNTVIGHADRGKWARRRPQKVAERKPRKKAAPKPKKPKAVKPPPSPELSTIFTRLDALHARMDAVLAETRPYVEDRKPLMVRVWAEDDPRRWKQAARLRALGGNLRQRGAAANKVAPLTPEEDARDALLSYEAGMRAIGDKVKQGEPVPTFLQSRKVAP